MTLPPCDAPTKIFVKDVAQGGCTGALCHAGSFMPDLRTPAGLRNTLIAETSMTSMAPCLGKKIIDAANPAGSVILKRVQGADCGEQMPSMLFGALAHLSQADQDCVAGWVENP